VGDVKTATRGSWGATCWDLFPRYTSAEQRARGLDKGGEAARRAELARLSRRPNAPGLIAYRDREPIGWIAIGPRLDFSRIDRSRATPRVDNLDVWVVPCITVRRGHRGKGVAIAMIRAAVGYAARFGAAAVEAYPRASNARTHDDLAFYGTEAMFRKAGFRQIRGPLPNLPRAWTPRVTMRSARTLVARAARVARPNSSRPTKRPLGGTVRPGQGRGRRPSRSAPRTARRRAGAPDR
jgi:GNAT superfamily N-acetyltransferase